MMGRVKLRRVPCRVHRVNLYCVLFSRSSAGLIHVPYHFSPETAKKEQPGYFCLHYHLVLQRLRICSRPYP